MFVSKVGGEFHVDFNSPSSSIWFLTRAVFSLGNDASFLKSAMPQLRHESMDGIVVIDTAGILALQEHI